MNPVKISLGDIRFVTPLSASPPRSFWQNPVWQQRHPRLLLKSERVWQELRKGAGYRPGLRSLTRPALPTVTLAFLRCAWQTEQRKQVSGPWNPLN